MELKKTSKVSDLSHVRQTAEIHSPGSQWRPDLAYTCISLTPECLSSRNVLILKCPVGKRSVTAPFYRWDGGAEGDSGSWFTNTAADGKASVLPSSHPTPALPFSVYQQKHLCYHQSNPKPDTLLS